MIAARILAGRYFFHFLILLPFSACSRPAADPASIADAVLGPGCSDSPAGRAAAPEKRGQAGDESAGAKPNAVRDHPARSGCFAACRSGIPRGRRKRRRKRSTTRCSEPEPWLVLRRALWQIRFRSNCSAAFKSIRNLLELSFARDGGVPRLASKNRPHLARTSEGARGGSGGPATPRWRSGSHRASPTTIFRLRRLSGAAHPASYLLVHREGAGGRTGLSDLRFSTVSPIPGRRTGLHPFTADRLYDPPEDVNVPRRPLLQPLFHFGANLAMPPALGRAGELRAEQGRGQIERRARIVDNIRRT